jgi:TP901 family phage tail tape measure protein
MSKVEGGKVFVEIGADPRKLFKALGDINKLIGKIGASMSQLGARMTAVGVAISAPIGLAVRQFAGFDDAIRATAAVSQASGAELQKLNDTARDLGATTSFTAIQVANLMTELGRAGFKPDEINAMTGAVLDLARATGTDATLASGIMAASLRQFGLGAAEATRAADVLTKAANSTFNTVEGLGESLKYAGPVAKSLGMSLEDTTAILGVLGNVGIQGSEAGTALRRLSVIAAGSGEELQKLFGISNTDAAGNLKPLVDILDEINTVTAGMPVAERTAKMAKAFGLLGITSANVLSSSAEGVRGLADQLRNAEGTSARAAKEMDAGLGGSMRITLSAIEGTALAIGDALNPSLQRLIDGIGNVATGLTAFVKENEALVVSAAKGIATFTGVGLALMAVGKSLAIASGAIGVLLALMNPLGIIATTLAAMVGSSLAFSGALGDMGRVATTTFGGIYEAIADGDLSGAMDVLWAGLKAGWLRGVEALMGYVDPWVSLFQNTFTTLGAEIYKVWDGTWTKVGNALNTAGAYLQGTFDNIINGVQRAWDTLEAGIRKSWNYIQSFFKSGMDLEAENRKVDDEMSARARKRELERPGIEGRTQAADKKNQEANQKLKERQDAVDANTDQTIGDREAENRKMAADRRQTTQDAEANVTGMARGKRETRARNDQFTRLLKEVEGATSLDALRGMYEEFDALSSSGRLTSAQMSTLETALEDAQERVSKAGSGMGGQSPSDRIRSGAGAAAGETAQSQTEMAGTFSSVALGGLGIGSSLAQKQVDLLGKIEQNTRVSDDGLVAA